MGRVRCRCTEVHTVVDCSWPSSYHWVEKVVAGQASCSVVHSIGVHHLGQDLVDCGCRGSKDCR